MQEIKDKIKELGIKEDRIEELYNLLGEEVLNILFMDLTDKLPDEELAIIETRIKESKSTQHFETIINEIAVTVYGENAQQEIKNIYLDLIDQLKATIDQARDVVNRANNGDPQAQELIKNAQNSEEFKRIMEQQDI